MTIAAGETGIVRLYGYRDSVLRGFRARIDGGAWAQGTLSGSSDPSAQFFSSPSLAAGAHRFELEWVDSVGGFTFDYYEVEASPNSTTTSSSTTTTTTTNTPELTPPPTPTPIAGRTESEAVAHTASCWSVLSSGMFSGGAGRNCYAANAPFSWTVPVAAGESGIVRLYGYRDSVSRGFRIRVDGGAWTQGTLSGSFAPSALFFTSPSLAPGSHRFELEWSDSGGGFTLDFFEVERLATCTISPADGHAAIAAAISSCPNGSTVQFPPGALYRQSGPIDVTDRANLVIDGGGSSFGSSAPNTTDVRPNWRVIRGRNVTLRNMTVVGNFTSPGPRDIRTVASNAANQHNSAFFVQGGDGVTISDVKVRDVFGDLVTLVPSGWTPDNAAVGTEIPKNVRLVRLEGTRAARHCVAVAAVSGLWLEDSTLRDCWYAAVDIEPDAVGEPARDIHILRNTLDGYNLFGIAVPAPGNTGDVDGIEIRGNETLTTGDTCLGPVLVGYYPSNPNRILNVVTEDNRFKGLGAGISYDHVQGGSIRNNRVEKTAPDSLCGPPQPVSVKVTSSVDVTVAGNQLFGYAS